MGPGSWAMGPLGHGSWVMGPLGHGSWVMGQGPWAPVMGHGSRTRVADPHSRSRGSAPGERPGPSECCSYTVLPNTLVRLFRKGRLMSTDRSA
ncbi:hypothetical protein E3E14_15225 [Streptomyces sp. ICN441]|nr:hypothetical protein E3E14_15225 [Streptomyces sp. ICN441]